MTDKRLLYFMDTHVMGGAEKYLADLINGMKAKGYDITVVCHDFSELINFLRSQTCGNCTIIPQRFPSITRTAAVQSGLALNRSSGGRFNLLKIPGLLWMYVNTLRAAFVLYRIFKKYPQDILHINAGGYPAAESNRAAVWAATLTRIPRRVMTIHNQAKAPPLSFPEHGIDRRVEKSLDAILTASQDAKDKLVQERGFDAAHISVIYYGIRSDSAASASPSALRQELGIPEGKKLIGTIGSLDPRKGHRNLLDAFALVRRQDPDVHLVIIGKGACQEALTQQANALGISGSLSLAGYRPLASRFLRAMDLFVFSSNAYECLPYVVLEAMDAGIPIVSTAVGGTVEEIENGVSGMLVRPEDPEAMAAAIITVMSDRQKASQMAVKARERVAALFSFDRMISETDRFYHSKTDDSLPKGA